MEKIKWSEKVTNEQVLGLNLPFFPPSSHSQVCFLSYRPFVVNAIFSTDLAVSSVSWLVQMTVEVSGLCS